MPSDFKFPQNEKSVLEFWQSIQLYTDKIIEKNKLGPTFNFQDGPPFVSSAKLHFGHIHISIMKSCLVNYLNMHGFNVLNKSGKDCHGLPIETITSEILGLKTNDDIKTYGLANYNAKCDELIKSFSKSWNPIFDRIGRFLDSTNEYYTTDLNFMESVWWAWKQLYEKNLVYRGYKIMPYSTACGTPISASEASGDDVYKEVTDSAIYVKFKLINYPDTYVIVWTTTPWTLPSNLAIATNSNILYVKILDLKSAENYIVARSCIGNLYPQSKIKVYEIVEEFAGTKLLNEPYVPIFDYFAKNRQFKIITADFVTEGSGTGLVHLAPAFGEDDFNVCISNNIVTVEDVGTYCPINDNGMFTELVVDYVGLHVLATNPLIIDRLKQSKVLLKKESYKHSYPHCWRTDTPLIYKAVSSFFIKVTAIKDRLMTNNDRVTWVPENIGSGRFKKWLENSKDWGVSRSRFFGTPIPVWISADKLEVVCVGSIDELVELAGLDYRPENLHPQYINHIQIPSKQGKGMLTIVSEVFDCWFESGCVPVGQIHYPFENKNFFDNVDYMCDFVCEGLDQTRGWFYALSVLSTALFDKPPFRNVICSGLILASDGKKFSKRLGNFVSPIDACDLYGTDSLRLYLLGSPAAHGEPFQFNEDHIKEISTKYFQWYNSFKFLIENIIKYEKDGNQFDLSTYQKSTNIMDQWILSRVRSVLINIELHMTHYEFYKVKPEILDFIEDLTNWYIKFNRNRLRGRYSSAEEQGRTLSTLYMVIQLFGKIVAPFAPFLTETMYQKLSILDHTREQSIHLCMYPSVNTFPFNPHVEKQMKLLQIVCTMVRNLRTKTKTAVSVKVPLACIIIVSETGLDDLKALEQYLYEEINTLDIVYVTTYGTTTYKLEPNNKELGLKYKAGAKDIKEKLAELSQDQIMTCVLNPDAGINLGTIILTEPYFSITKSQELNLKPMELSITSGSVTVIIDSTYDQIVMETHLKRLLIVQIQKMRKNTKLRPWNKIGIYYKTDSELIDQVILKYYDEIAQELNFPVCPIDKCKETEAEIISTNCDINGINVWIKITDLDGSFFDA